MKSRERVSVNGESGGCGGFKNFHKYMGKRHNNLPLCGPRHFLFDCGVCLLELLREKSRLINYNIKSSTGDIEGLLRHAYADVCCRSSWINSIIYNAAPDLQGDFFVLCFYLHLCQGPTQPSGCCTL